MASTLRDTITCPACHERTSPDGPCMECGAGRNVIACRRCRRPHDPGLATHRDVPSHVPTITADLQAALATLPGVGPTVASRVVAAHPTGPDLIAHIDTLETVEGVGRAKAARIARWAVGRPPGTFAADRCPPCQARLVGSRQHSWKAAASGSCACTPCTDKLDILNDIAARRFAGETLESIGDSLDVTRERARQLTDLARPDKPWLAAATEARALAADVAAASQHVPCAVCGDPASRRFCTATCRTRWASLRYHIDPDRRRDQAVANAHWVLANVTDDTARARHAERIMAGHTPDPSWLVRGSMPWDTVARAIAGSWPILRHIPPVLIQQVADDVDAGTPPPAGPDARHAAILQVCDGLSLTDAAGQLGISATQMHNLMAAAIRDAGDLPAATAVAAVQLVAAGQPASAVAATLDVAPVQVYAACRAARVRPSAWSPRRRKLQADVAAAHAAGQQPTTIAAALGVTADEVYRWIAPLAS